MDTITLILILALGVGLGVAFIKTIPAVIGWAVAVAAFVFIILSI